MCEAAPALPIHDMNNYLRLNLKSTMQIQFQDVMPTSYLIATFKFLLNGNSKIIPD